MPKTERQQQNERDRYFAELDQMEDELGGVLVNSPNPDRYNRKIQSIRSIPNPPST